MSVCMQDLLMSGELEPYSKNPWTDSTDGIKTGESKSSQQNARPCASPEAEKENADMEGPKNSESRGHHSMALRD
ncbi:hypothetical protein QE152_g35193 [Popillia japonica]|uniref:Prolactin receptor n=1 Tax=Popillia japonica TaxID=7064 RepID=A0AAW1IG74_POPJA